MNYGTNEILKIKILPLITQFPDNDKKYNWNVTVSQAIDGRVLSWIKWILVKWI